MTTWQRFWQRLRERIAWRQDRHMSEAEFQRRAKALEGRRRPRITT